MIKQFELGKIDYMHMGRRNNAVDLEVELREDKYGRPVFSARGRIWNTRHTDVVCAGQCLDEIVKRTIDLYANRTLDTFLYIYSLWKKYHLNDMHAGTPEQEEAVNKWKEAGNKYDYTEACKYLESIGLYEVPYKSLEFTGIYAYGSAWLYREIDSLDLRRIHKLMKAGE